MAWFTGETNKTSRQEVCTTYVGLSRPLVYRKVPHPRHLLEWVVLFPPKVDVLDEPSKEVWLVQLNEADVLLILVETLAAHIEAVFPDQTMPV